MVGILIRQVKRRRDELHRRIEELRAELKDVEAQADELEREWRQAIQAGECDWKVPRLAEISRKVRRNASGLILFALTEFEDHGFEGADRATIVSLVRAWMPRLKPNTIRVTFKRLVETGRIEKVGNLYRLGREAAATKKAAAA